jgi:signal transduction histidine kinase/DNA-binding NarL/FixJ family response regulator
MDAVSLRDFLIGVPTCVETDSLMQVWQVFQEAGCLHIVIVNQQQVALGVLSLHHFVPHVFSSKAAHLLEQHSIQNLIQDLQQQTNAQAQPLLEPILALPVDWNLNQLRAHLPTYLPTVVQDWGLADSQGRYVGLLDRLRLLQQFAATPDRIQPLPPELTSLQAEAAITPVDPLVDLLERLPIPLMLQTSTGRIVAQNWVWRRQVGELQDPGQIRQEAALILEAIAPTEHYAALSGRYPSADAALAQRQSNRSELPGFYTGSWDHASTLLNSTRYSGACQLSTEPNACVCTCPMKDGQDRVWQFAKISMGRLPAGLSSDQASHLLEIKPDVMTMALPFKLATLNSHPDPGWRSLIQTESLWLVLAQDMTEQHQVAKELSAKNADLIQLNRLKDEFLACISHELKTPLTAVLGLSSLLKDKLLGELNERQSRYAHLIHQSGRHLILIVNDILDLTRIETGQLQLSLEPIQVATVCQQAYEQVNLQTQDSPLEAVQFTLETQPGLDMLVADPLRLRQMLSNLLSNALKFTAAGGQIGLKVEDWEGWIAFTVWDTGIGIPIDKQHLIFQKFQQLENPLTRQFEGTGLGLVLTQRLARLHGGDITFTSVEGRGSEFTLLLPPCPPPAAYGNELEEDEDWRTESRPAVKSNITSDNRLVLVVEAAPQAIDNLTHHLTGLGYRVAIARSGTEAVEKVRRLKPCVIFLNPSLPLLSGWDVLTLLKTDTAIQHIPVVVTAMRLEKHQAHQSGADGFLSLPVQASALERCLERVVIPKVDPVDQSLLNLTVLHLRGQTNPLADASLPDLNRLLHPYQCRVLEVDDLDQADLLSRVWQPNVMLIDGTFANPLAFVEQLSQSAFLAALPLVTLTAEMTQAANQIQGLAVFPCFASMQPDNLPANPSSEPSQEFNQSEVSALLQVIQMAVGTHWQPHILIADFSALEQDWSTVAAPRSRNAAKLESPKAPSGLQALVQYMTKAGYRSSVGNSWSEVLRQLQHQSSDLLLLYVNRSKPHPLLIQMAQDLQKLAVRPPVFVWYHNPAPLDEATDVEFASLWGAIATQVLPPGLSMSDLLTEINQRLTPKKDS